MKAPIIETGRLVLQPLSFKHLSHDYVSWMNDLEVIRYLESGGNYTLEKLRSFLEEQERKDIFFWAIHLKENSRHIGNIKIDPINISENSGEYGIMMGDKSEWGKGYAKEASMRVIEYCFKNIGLSKITLGVVEDNISAVELYIRMGFKVVEKKNNTGVYQGKLCSSIRMVLGNGE
jgi:[ribosomal protein S5]-alanine N-acetyltransferase